MKDVLVANLRRLGYLDELFDKENLHQGFTRNIHTENFEARELECEKIDLGAD